MNELAGMVDCHTHSFCSHDSVCDPQEMFQAMLKAGIAGFAITDHCDIEYYIDEDYMIPLDESFEWAKRLDNKNLRVFSGIEIGGGVRNPKRADKAAKRHDYDIVLGSVHGVVYNGRLIPGASTDFSNFPQKDLDGYLGAYFSETLGMLKTCDMDVLTHFTYPLRYIVLKYGRSVDLGLFSEVIGDILKTVIQKGIALEVNTAKMQMGTTPCEDILRRYFDLGGRLITLASDAHVSANAAKEFAAARKLLKDIGFEKAYYYQKRQPIAYLL